MGSMSNVLDNQSLKEYHYSFDIVHSIYMTNNRISFNQAEMTFNDVAYSNCIYDFINMYLLYLFIYSTYIIKYKLL